MMMMMMIMMIFTFLCKDQRGFYFRFHITLDIPAGEGGEGIAQLV